MWARHAGEQRQPDSRLLPATDTTRLTLPWSTWPIMVTTGGRGMASSAVHNTAVSASTSLPLECSCASRTCSAGWHDSLNADLQSNKLDVLLRHPAGPRKRLSPHARAAARQGRASRVLRGEQLLAKVCQQALQAVIWQACSVELCLSAGSASSAEHCLPSTYPEGRQALVRSRRVARAPLEAESC